MRRALCVLTPLLLLAHTLASADSAIDPDRPDFSSSARTISRGVVQLETGIAYEQTTQAAGRAERRLAVEAMLRVGVLDRVELRLEGEPLVRLRGGEEDTGHDDFTLSVVARLWDPPDETAWPTLGALAFVKPPITEAPIGTGRPDAGLIALASFELPADFALDLNAGVAVLGQTRPNGYLAGAIMSASLGRKVTKRLGAFIEFFFTSLEERGTRDQAGIQAGLIYLITGSLAVDAAVLTSLMGRAPDYAVRAGVSLRSGR